jgi:hypothetical protein
VAKIDRLLEGRPVLPKELETRELIEVVEAAGGDQMVKLASKLIKKNNKPKEVDAREKEVEDEKRRYLDMERRNIEAEEKRARIAKIEEEKTLEDPETTLGENSNGGEICNLQFKQLSHSKELMKPKFMTTAMYLLH